MSQFVSNAIHLSRKGGSEGINKIECNDEELLEAVIGALELCGFKFDPSDPSTLICDVYDPSSRG